MKLGIAERMSTVDGWENGDGETATTQTYILAQEQALDDSSARGQEVEEDEETVSHPRRQRRKARRVSY